MFRLIGCLVVVVCAFAAGWYMKGRISSGSGDERTAAASVASAVKWEELSAEHARTAAARIDAFERGATSPLVLSASEAASYLLFSGVSALPASTQNARAAIINGDLAVSADVLLGELNAGPVLGPLVSMLGDREELLLQGHFTVARRGMGALRITEFRLGSVKVPGALLPAILKRLIKGDRPEGVSAGALPLPLPDHILDVRVADGSVLVYRRPD